MLSRARQRHSKQELGKEVLREVSFPPSGSNRNVTVTSTSGKNYILSMQCGYVLKTVNDLWTCENRISLKWYC